MFPLLTLLIGCPQPGCDGDDCVAAQGDQLEAVLVDQSACFYDDCADYHPAGALTIDGAVSDWTLTFGSETFGVHSPARTNLGSLAGQELTASFASDFQGHDAVALTDAAGLVYLAEPTDASLLAADHLGEGFIRFGTATAEPFVDDDDYQITFGTAIVKTDAGDLEVSPGEVHTITAGGVMYRFVLVASYTADEIEGGVYSDCGGRQDMLSFEVLRIESELSEQPLERGEEFEYAKASCGE